MLRLILRDHNFQFKFSYNKSKISLGMSSNMNRNSFKSHNVMEKITVSLMIR